MLESDMGELPEWLERDNAEDVLDKAYQKLKPRDDLVARRVYQELKMTVPDLPKVRFSNGDLYPDNFVIKDRKLVGVIDFANAAFSDPLYEFLLPFFIHPELRGRGTEEKYCERMGINPDVLPWYHVLEFYDLWGWLNGTSETFSGYNAEQIREILKRWLKHGKLP
jgi:aminoglycoside phosphotransferase (APT) family kinase protein